MAGNERLTTEYLFENIGFIELAHVGVVREISIPTKNGILRLQTKNDILQLSTQDASKKADIYINGMGVSIKQSGATFSFNRLQRADMLNFLDMLEFTHASNVLFALDDAIDNFHWNRIKGRNRPWNEIFEESNLYKLLKFLMMDGSPNYGYSQNRAELILQAPLVDIDNNNIDIFTFDEYFNKFKDDLKIAIRRSWIGQSSDGEHNRAVGLAKKEDNRKWVYESISGSPRRSQTTGKIWRDDVDPSDRRTVYYVSIEKSRQAKKRLHKG